jgi:DNA-binding NarL/FixJ family response regulator
MGMTGFANFAVDDALRSVIDGFARSAGTLIDSTGDLAVLNHLLQRDDVDLAIAEWRADADLGKLMRTYRRIPFIALAAIDDIEDAIVAGAQAVLSYHPPTTDLTTAVAAVRAGFMLTPRGSLARFLDVDVIERDDDTAPPLTPREGEVLAAMTDGASNKVIARRLGISFHTVKFHVAAILAKLDAETRTEAIARAARLGLVML